MRHSFKVYIILFLLGGIGLNIRAQQKDLQLRTGIELSKELPFNIDGALEIEQRFKENISRYDRTHMSLGLGYEILPDLKLSGAYRFVYLKNDELTFTQKYRLNADLRYKTEIFDVDIKLRTRLQYGFDDNALSASYYDQKLVNRNLLEISYGIKRTRFKPYVSVELFTHLNDEEGANLNKSRLQFGTEVKLTSAASLDVLYMLEDEFNVVEPWQSHILSLSYSYEF